jgi:hypothetical protein
MLTTMKYSQIRLEMQENEEELIRTNLIVAEDFVCADIYALAL